MAERTNGAGGALPPPKNSTTSRKTEIGVDPRLVHAKGKERRQSLEILFDRRDSGARLLERILGER